MKPTIKDVARLAGVSIATVSHVINRTRFVSPQLIETVEQAIRECGYTEKAAKKQVQYRVGQGSEIALVVPGIENTVYNHYATALSRGFADHGLLLSIHISNDDLARERHILGRLAVNKTISGIILAPATDSPKIYAKIIKGNIPLICLERRIDHPGIDCVLSEGHQAIYQGTEHLVRAGHDCIAFIMEDRKLVGGDERLEGYRAALRDNKVPFRRDLVIRVDHNNHAAAADAIRQVWASATPTAFLAAGNKLTLLLATALDGLGLECPRDVSIVGYGDEEWCAFARPPLTAIQMDADAVSRITVERMLEKIDNRRHGRNELAETRRVPVRLVIRGSTQVVSRGPFGEKAYPPEVLNITESERHRLRRGNFKVGISFHYSGTAWKRLHESGIRDTFDRFGIKVIAVTEAHFDPQLQVTQLESLRIHHPDAIIAIPADDKVTAKKFKSLARETKLVFLSAIPETFKQNDYAGCVTVNERESGRTVGLMMGEFAQGRPLRVGFITHGAPFYGTLVRDRAAEQVVRENYPHIQVVDIQPFYDIERTHEVAKRMIATHPDIEALYISWERPALHAIRALKEMRREDMAIFTFDLDREIAGYMARGEMVAGLSTQRPYEQGVAVAQLTAKTLLGDNPYKYVIIQPYSVQPKNLVRAWHDIIHEPPPEEVAQAWNFYVNS
ncbi:MAG: LacI family DNA-binding transcriptional regulator [Planctomycetaceae bacterium]|nr:LacI family DNA-binding transcriptional regulator [Planctomycetaceae bacterium]